MEITEGEGRGQRGRDPRHPARPWTRRAAADRGHRGRGGVSRPPRVRPGPAGRARGAPGDAARRRPAVAGRPRLRRTPLLAAQRVRPGGPPPPGPAAWTAGQVARYLGISESTLRTWHRRYGLSPLDAEPGRYRRYQPGDVARLRRMVDLIGDGMLASEAAREVQAGNPDRGSQPAPGPARTVPGRPVSGLRFGAGRFSSRAVSSRPVSSPPVRSRPVLARRRRPGMRSSPRPGSWTPGAAASCWMSCSPGMA